ncbi:MAG: hypothetical protein A3F11_03565 [Gammaproteobacteria bacterium RIFCSPHIGHO2_12_FULL_37_14]|nr:MAG: hypothetical protein A3F11_03565 [Gammaproteobacteria bacterium RIFCSPHIGHO2_12_FULL_37_14]
MFYLFGADYHLSNIKKISGVNKECKCTETLKSGFNRFLAADSIFSRQVDWMSPMFVNFLNSAHYSQKYFKEKHVYFDINSPEIDLMIHDGYFENVYNDLKDINRPLFDMANIVIKVIIINRLKKYTNGTTEDALGLAIIDYKLSFNKIDFQELIFHQIIHMLTFLDDKINSHLPDCLKTELVSSDFIHKAGGNQFPLYIIFHSYLVGIEILIYRLHMNILDFEGNYHGSTKRLIARCTKASQMLNDHLDKFTEQSKMILSKANASLISVSDKYYAESH